MVKLTSPIALAGIGIALIIVFLSISKFGIPTITKLGSTVSDALSNAGTGFTDFFDGLEANQEERDRESIRKDDGSEFFDNIGDPIKVDNKNPSEFLQDLDPESPTFEQDKIDALELFGITGADSIEILDNGGLKIVQGDRESNEEPFDLFKNITDFFTNFGQIPNANAEEQIKGRATESIMQNPQGNTEIEGTVRNLTDDESKDFKVFNADSSRSVSGTIRETKKNPISLRTDSKKNPTETASERANRVFIEEGKFAGEGRGFGITKATLRNKNFKFGTNQSQGLKIATTNKGGERSNKKKSNDRLKEARRLSIERAMSIFDSRSIQN